MTKSRFFAAVVASLGLGALVGCGGEDDRSPDWAYIAPVILAPNCATASCHSEAAAVSGLDLSTPEKAYKSLTGLEVVVDRGEGFETVKPIPDCAKNSDARECLSPRPFVTPYVPDQSLLVKMLRAEGALRMPPDRPLAEGDVALVESWIAAGAKEGK